MRPRGDGAGFSEVRRVGLGLLVLAVGVWFGGRVFDARGPEMIAAAIRA